MNQLDERYLISLNSTSTRNSYQEFSDMQSKMSDVADLDLASIKGFEEIKAGLNENSTNLQQAYREAAQKFKDNIASKLAANNVRLPDVDLNFTSIDNQLEIMLSQTRALFDGYVLLNLREINESKLPIVQGTESALAVKLNQTFPQASIRDIVENINGFHETELPMTILSPMGPIDFYSQMRVDLQLTLKQGQNRDGMFMDVITVGKIQASINSLLGLKDLCQVGTSIFGTIFNGITVQNFSINFDEGAAGKGSGTTSNIDKQQIEIEVLSKKSSSYKPDISCVKFFTVSQDVSYNTCIPQLPIKKADTQSLYNFLMERKNDDISTYNFQ